VVPVVRVPAAAASAALRAGAAAIVLPAAVASAALRAGAAAIVLPAAAALLEDLRARTSVHRRLPAAAASGSTRTRTRAAAVMTTAGRRSVVADPATTATAGSRF
jgi:hypothetical protein